MLSSSQHYRSLLSGGQWHVHVLASCLVLLFLNNNFGQAGANGVNFNQVYPAFQSWQAGLPTYPRCLSTVIPYTFQPRSYLTAVVPGSCISTPVASGVQSDKDATHDTNCDYTMQQHPTKVIRYSTFSRTEDTSDEVDWILNFTTAHPLPLTNLYNPNFHIGRSLEHYRFSCKSGCDNFTTTTYPKQNDLFSYWRSAVMAISKKAPRIPIFSFRILPVTDFSKTDCPPFLLNARDRGLTLRTNFSGPRSLVLVADHAKCANFVLKLTKPEGMSITREMLRLYKNEYLLTHDEPGVDLKISPLTGNYEYLIQVCYHKPRMQTAAAYVLAIYVNGTNEEGSNGHYQIEQTLLHEFNVTVANPVFYSQGCSSGEYLSQVGTVSIPVAKSVPTYQSAETECRKIGGVIPDAVAFVCLVNLLRYANTKVPGWSNTEKAGPFMYLPNRVVAERWLGSDTNTRPVPATGLTSGRVICLMFHKVQYGCPKGWYLRFPPGYSWNSATYNYTEAGRICGNAGMSLPSLSLSRCLEIFLLRSQPTYPAFARAGAFYNDETLNPGHSLMKFDGVRIRVLTFCSTQDTSNPRVHGRAVCAGQLQG